MPVLFPVLWEWVHTVHIPEAITELSQSSIRVKEGAEDASDVVDGNDPDDCNKQRGMEDRNGEGLRGRWLRTEAGIRRRGTCWGGCKSGLGSWV